MAGFEMHGMRHRLPVGAVTAAVETRAWLTQLQDKFIMCRVTGRVSTAAAFIMCWLTGTPTACLALEQTCLVSLNNMRQVWAPTGLPLLPDDPV